MTIVDAINVFEVVWWTGCGVVVLVKTLRAGNVPRGRGYFVAATFVLFGLSDVVELQTGAWWRPWWLLVWKAACIIVLVDAAVRSQRDNRKQSDADVK
jgi:hypothetical protein